MPHLGRLALLHQPLPDAGDHQQQLHLGRVADCGALVRFDLRRRDPLDVVGVQ